MPRTRRSLPRTIRLFESQFPEIWTQYRALREACDHVGPLTPKTRELIKIGIEVAKKRHGGLVAHISRAQAAGASKAEVYQAILLATPLVGMPDVLDAFLVATQKLG